jgi:hypothetical protein
MAAGIVIDGPVKRSCQAGAASAPQSARSEHDHSRGARYVHAARGRIGWPRHPRATKGSGPGQPSTAGPKAGLTTGLASVSPEAAGCHENLPDPSRVSSEPKPGDSTFVATHAQPTGSTRGLPEPKPGRTGQLRAKNSPLDGARNPAPAGRVSRDASLAELGRTGQFHRRISRWEDPQMLKWTHLEVVNG